MTLPGTPYLYYGDELGMKSAPAVGDRKKRGPMAWSADPGHGFTTGTPWVAAAPMSDVRNVATALADPASLARYTQALIALRHAHPALAGARLSMLPSSDPDLLVMLRSSPDEVLVAAVNLGASPIATTQLDLSQATATLATGRWSMQDLLTGLPEIVVTDPSAVLIDASNMNDTSWAPLEGRLWKVSRAF